MFTAIVHFQRAKEAYQSLLVLRIREPITPEYALFAQKAKQKSLDEWGLSYDELGFRVSDSKQKTSQHCWKRIRKRYGLKNVGF